MSSSSNKHGYRNVPPPQGSKAGTAYTRFIPREELGDFAAWTPGHFGSAPKPGPASAPAPAAPPEPSADDWRARIASSRQSGYQDGYRDGLVALEAFKQSFATEATSQIGALLTSFDEQLDQLDQQLAEAVARTAVQLARQVVRSELKTQPELIVTVATDALNAVLMSARHITVQVHPMDLPLVAEGAEEALEARGARLVAQPGMPRGGVQVQSDLGTVDASIDTRWGQAAAALGVDQPWDEA